MFLVMFLLVPGLAQVHVVHGMSRDGRAPSTWRKKHQTPSRRFLEITPHRESGSTIQEHARTRHVSFFLISKTLTQSGSKFFPFIHLPLNFVVFRFFLLSFCCLPSRKTTPTPDISLAVEKVSKSPEQNKRPHKSGGRNGHS